MTDYRVFKAWYSRRAWFLTVTTRLPEEEILALEKLWKLGLIHSE
jgi:hypothetical protein